MTSTTMTLPSVRRSFMRAEDEPITLKKKACRPVCRRQSVMIERGNLLFADLCRALKKLRILRMNRLGLSWSDEESRFSMTVKQRFENTNSRPIMTAEVFRCWMKWSSRTKKKFVVFIKETNDADKIINFFMILFSTESEETDWRKSLNSPKASPATKAQNSLSIAGKMKKLVVLLSTSSRVSWLQVWKQMHSWLSLPLSRSWW